MDRADAANHIRALFGDDGATVLAEAGLGETWEAALASVPPRALDVRGDSPHPKGERILSLLRDFWGRTGQLRPAIAATRGLLRLRVARLGNGSPDTLIELGALGALADRAGRVKDARGMLEEAWQGLRASVGGRDARVAIVAANLGVHYLRRGELGLAETTLEQAYRIRKEHAPESVGVVAAQLAEARLRLEKTEEAVPLLTEAWDLAKRQLGPLHARTIARARVLAQVLTRLERHLQAEPVLRQLYQKALDDGDGHAVAEAGFELGVGLIRVRLDEEGFRHVEQSIRQTRALGDPHPALPERLAIWSRLLLLRRHVEESEGVLKEAIEAEKLLHGEASAEVGLRYVELAQLLVQLGRREEAMGWLDPAVSLLRGTLGDDHTQTRVSALLLTEMLLERARHALKLKDRGTARELRGRALTLVPVIGPGHSLSKEVEDLRV